MFTVVKQERTIHIYVKKSQYKKVTLQTSRISNANLPSHILTRMQSPSVNCSLVGSPGSFKYKSMKLCTELQNFTGSSIFKYLDKPPVTKWKQHNSLDETMIYDSKTDRNSFTLTCLLLFNKNNELSGESTGPKSFRILSCIQITPNKISLVNIHQCRWVLICKLENMITQVYFSAKKMVSRFLIMSPATTLSFEKRVFSSYQTSYFTFSKDLINLCQTFQKKK